MSVRHEYHPSVVEGAAPGVLMARVDESVAFLRKFHPVGPWAITTFGSNNEVGPAATFWPDTALGRAEEAWSTDEEAPSKLGPFHPDKVNEKALHRFLERVAGAFNVYFSASAVTGIPVKKVGKADIGEMSWLYVDADLNKTINWTDPVAVETEKARVLAKIRAYSPPPTVIVWSGGGFQGFWRLSDIVVVNGDSDLMRPIERRMEIIEAAFDADSCHNADRVMRLPGTINVLGKNKIKAGRKPALAEIIEFHDDRIYDLEDFPEPPPLEPKAKRPKTNGAASSHAFDYDRIAYERARDALRSIPAHVGRNDWRDIGMALKDEFGEAGYALWLDWSQTSTEKFDARDIRYQWDSFKGAGITIATLFKQARDRGWSDGSRKADGAQAEKPELPPDMSIVNRNRVAAVPFPVETLRSAASWVVATAESKSAPVDYVALALLVVATGAIGPKRRITPWGGWDEPSILWGALVGKPGTNKSPAIDPLQNAMRAIERSLNLDWPDRQARYETAKQSAETLRTIWEQQVKEALRAGLEPPQMPASAIEPKPPTKDTIWVGNITSEQMARKLGQNAGLVSFRDELSGLLGGFDKYGGAGGDRSFWLECYGGRPYRYDRVSLKEPIDVAFCAVSLLGGIQPDRLDSMLMSGDDDGLAARVIFAWPDAVQRKRPTKLVDDSKLHSALSRLRDMTFPILEDGTQAPVFVQLESSAADEFQSWWVRRQYAVESADSPLIGSAMAKIDGLTLRIAQTLELLEWAWTGSNTPEPTQVGMKSLILAMRITDEWVQPNLLRVYDDAALPQDQRDAMAVARWLLKHRPEKINARLLRLQAAIQGIKTAEAMDAALEVLVDSRWLTPAGARQGNTKGRASKDFLVNEAVYKETQP